MKNRLSNQMSEVASAGLSLGVLGLTASLMLMGCSDRHRDAGNVVTPTATNVQSDSKVAESTDQLPAGMPATSIDDGTTSGTTTGADADTTAATTDTTTTHKSAANKMHRRHMHHASAHRAAKHGTSKASEAPAAAEAAPATATGGGTDSGSTSSANSDMSGSTSGRVQNDFLSAPGRKASALTDQGVTYRIDDAAAASTLQ